MPTRAAQPFFEHRAGHARVRAGEQPGGVDLHHFYVAQRQPRAPGHRQAVAALVAGGRVVLVHRRSAAGCQQDCLGAHEHVLAGSHVDEKHARQGASIPGSYQLDCTVLLQPRDAARPDLLGEPVDDLDACEVALVHGAVERLPGEGLLVDAAVGIAVEKAAELVFQLADPLNGQGHQLPGEVLVGKPLAAFDGVHEVALDRVALCQRDVVAALHHARAAAFAEQAFHGNGDRQLGRRLTGVQRGKKDGAARAEDQDVRVDARGNHCMTSTSTTSAKPTASNKAFGYTSRKPATTSMIRCARLVRLKSQPCNPPASATMPTAAVKVTSAIEPQSAPARVLKDPVRRSPVPLGSSTNMNGTRNAGVVYFQHCSVVL